MIKHINGDEFQKEVVESKDLILVDFFATWCGPCQMLSSVLENLVEERPEINVVKIDIDKDTKIAVENEITVVPTLIVYRDGKKIKTFEGFRDKEEIIEIIENS